MTTATATAPNPFPVEDSTLSQLSANPAATSDGKNVRRYHGHRRNSWIVEGDTDAVVELRARQRTFDGAYTRTALGNLGYALFVLKIFTPDFAKIGLVYVILSILILLIAQTRRRRSDHDWADIYRPLDPERTSPLRKASERLWGREFRTSGDTVVLLGIVVAEQGGLAEEGRPREDPASVSYQHRAGVDEEILHITPNGSRRSTAAGALGADEEALLKRASLEGYDTSLLALQPRGSTTITTDPSSSPMPSPRENTTHSLYTLPSFHLASQPFAEAEEETLQSDGDEASPLSGSFFNSSSLDGHKGDHIDGQPRRARRPSVTSIPSVSVSNPRNAANAYLHRAQMSESRLGKYTSGVSASIYSDDGADDAEKGGIVMSLSVRDLRGGGGGRRRPLWQRKGLLVFLSLLILVLCAALGVGLGVRISRLKSKQDDAAQEAKASSSSTSSRSSASLPDPATSFSPFTTDTPNMDTATLAQPVPSTTVSPSWTDPASVSTTDWAATPTDWTDPAAATEWNADGSQAGGGEGTGGGWWDENGVWHSG
ncbi:hypothetical protein JCM11251_007610 [Rhodosporidiobolus azoricus]